MAQRNLDPLHRRKDDLLTALRSYLADMLDGGGEAGYTGADVGECGRLLDACLATIAEADTGDDDSVRGAVQFTVLSLNRVNARCDGRLIETDQREALCSLLNDAANFAGVGAGEDITVAWREW